jgi:hypothetical protein
LALLIHLSQISSGDNYSTDVDLYLSIFLHIWLITGSIAEPEQQGAVSFWQKLLPEPQRSNFNSCSTYAKNFENTALYAQNSS